MATMISWSMDRRPMLHKCHIGVPILSAYGPLLLECEDHGAFILNSIYFKVSRFEGVKADYLHI